MEQPTAAAPGADVMEHGSLPSPKTPDGPSTMAPPPLPPKVNTSTLRGGAEPSSHRITKGESERSHSTGTGSLEDLGGSFRDDEDMFDDIGEDDHSTNSDWDYYGNVADTLDEYDMMVERLGGSEEWNPEQRKVHKLIYMRGLHPILPSFMKLDLKMWGITQPLDQIFAPSDSRKRVAIYVRGSEVAATKALEALFRLSQTVNDYEEIGYQDKIAPTIVKALSNYWRWALQDVGLGKKGIFSTLLIRSYPEDFVGDGDYDSEDEEMSDAPTTETGDVVQSTETDSVEASIETRSEQESDSDSDDSEDSEEARATEERQRRFTRAVSHDLKKRMLNMASTWRESLRNGSSQSFITKPPTLFGFAVVQHILMLVSHDSSLETNEVVVLEQIRLNDRGLWLWNALSIAIPISIARDMLVRTRESVGIGTPEKDDGNDDPDL